MSIELPPLPYPLDALEPFISARTLATHHGKHHRAYVEKTRLLAGERPGALEDIIVRAAADPAQKTLFNNAAQAWNHAFYWRSLRPKVSHGAPQGALAARIDADFGGQQRFGELFKAAAMGVFGSGWVWLVDIGGKLEIKPTANADTPIAHGQQPLLVLDVWEHAYYLDYQSRRLAYVEGAVDLLLDWEFAERNFARQEAVHA